MDQLINLATGGRHSAYYKRLLDLALAAVGPVAVPGDQSVALYINRGFPGSLGNRYYTFSVHTAATVLVPDSVLPHIRPENRGQDFPPGIPFRPLR